MIPLRLLGLGAAAFMVGCSPAPVPAPVINITVVIPPSPAPPTPPAAGLGQASINSPSEPMPFFNSWPEYGWRVIVCDANRAVNECRSDGPPLEFMEQCHDLEKIVKQAHERDTVTCQWTAIAPRERDPNPRVL